VAEARSGRARGFESCKLNAIDPQAYLADVITKIVNGHPNSRIDEFLPWLGPIAPSAGSRTWPENLKTALTVYASGEGHG
jgi:hypothetical protein